MKQEKWKLAFYEAMLSEMIAYAEIDLDTEDLQRVGGIWERDWQRKGLKERTVLQMIRSHIRETVHSPEAELWCSYFEKEQIRGQYLAGMAVQRHSFKWMIEGELRWVDLVIYVICGEQGEGIYALLCLKDVDKVRRREIAQESAANTDPLTSVYNRRMFERMVKRFIRQTEGAAEGALLLLDIDDFKSINDRFGHMEGDAALLGMAKSLRETFRHDDVIGRFGGDEFLVFVRNVTDREILNCRLNELFLVLQKQERMPLTCSVGISFVRRENFSYERSLREADLALYQGKRLGKNQMCYFEDM
ncbi:MAG: GGDEF domain-containing protein [Eubacteriales bacterium]|nr:GGDEF domain-containing protein [Eubacteriales bacterium]